MYEFNYRRPASLEDAIESLRAAEDGKLLAGGMTLLPTMKQRLASPSDLIDLAGLRELGGISRDGEAVVVGALTTHAAVAAAKEVRAAIPALATAADGIGDPRCRSSRRWCPGCAPADRRSCRRPRRGFRTSRRPGPSGGSRRGW